jgi:acyl-CoA synthetase (NDP forming)
LRALIDGRFQGRIVPVNPNAADVAGLRTVPSVRDLPEAVDLAVIALPREAVPAVVDDCAKRGVRAVIVMTSGFAETDRHGADLQRRLSDTVRRSGLRLLGPNCLGIVNPDPAVRLNATFIQLAPPHGRAAMASQSGALGAMLLAAAQRLHLGISAFVSIGNRADVTGNDVLEYWEEDPATDLILLYLESFGNPRRFARIARRVGRTKPIVAVKAGRTAAGRRAAESHTAALASDDAAVDALFRQTGVIRVDTLQDLLAVAQAFESQPLPDGKRVGIMTNAGGPAVLCSDACQAGGLIVPELSDRTQAALRSFLPAAAGTANPVDLIASVERDRYRRTVEVLLGSDELDALIVIHVSAGVADDTITAGILDGLAAARAGSGANTPVLACWMPAGDPAALRAARVPCYPFPETPALVLGKAAAYMEWKNGPAGTTPSFADFDLPTARAVVCKALERGAGWLTAQETRRILAAARLPLPPAGIAETAEEAVELARRIGFPVAVKLASHRILHKTEKDGVRLHLTTEDAVREAFLAIEQRLSREHHLDAMDGVLVQPMIAGGVEVMVGVAQDPLFGPLIAFGLGGIHVEILGDVCFRVAPLTDRDAAEMVRSIKGYRLLDGYRGHAPADVPAIEEALLRVSHLVETVPEIVEMDLNPLFALAPGQGCRIADARVRLSPPGVHADGQV